MEPVRTRTAESTIPIHAAGKAGGLPAVPQGQHQGHQHGGSRLPHEIAEEEGAWDQVKEGRDQDEETQEDQQAGAGISLPDTF